MSHSHAIRITLPFGDVSGTIRSWADRCHALVAYEHCADEEISKTHVHLALYGCEVKAEALKRMFLGAPGKGNGFWSFKNLDDVFLSDLVRTSDAQPVSYIKYMTKGNLEPKFVKNISNEVLEVSRQQWVNSVEESPAGATEKMIRDVMLIVKSKMEEREHRNLAFSVSSLFGLCRSTAFHIMYRRNRLMPHGTQYKIVAGSAFLRLSEEYSCFEESSGIISEAWL